VHQAADDFLIVGGPGGMGGEKGYVLDQQHRTGEGSSDQNRPGHIGREHLTAEEGVQRG
jgi:hypothetical protein